MTRKDIDILILDDDVDLLTSVAELLADCGYRVKGFADPESAVEFAVDQTFAVGLFDFRLGSVKNGLDVVEMLQVMGAGAVGCEFADVFNAFGSQVTLIDVMPVILPLEDADASKEVERSFKKRGITVLTAAKISNVKAGKDSVSMSVEAAGERGGHAPPVDTESRAGMPSMLCWFLAAQYSSSPSGPR